jgi:hypothetical protein
MVERCLRALRPLPPAEVGAPELALHRWRAPSPRAAKELSPVAHALAFRGSGCQSPCRTASARSSFTTPRAIGSAGLLANLKQAELV